ncbi:MULTISPECIES: energy-coupling factor transporter transmembrane component T family protein [Bordetella]|uniref:Cobalt transport protein n=2 Tax=Bordetella TaxID=517 RepID=K0MIM5_BORPB|nr:MULTISPECIES: energy-coupling factor transporter transmembrane protein EcfT [Bordetella]KAK62540.1 cobalt transport domain protein [Bordetella bronchiseptica 980-2]AMG89856.1 energy-coupling factor transporter transmembrane protein EcfT [Bordetella bronchiseptica]KCV61333.1 cobalt transport domain protein [Bordetella bronchiseptica 980]KDB88805.1 cobalt transport protein [Bordetella bronchiseptica D756]KDB89203.1 cobalt transport domain protein [Bordetella bronchiseptica D989]
MIEPLYVAGASFLHRLPAGLKLAALALAGVGLFLLSDWRVLAAVLAGAALLVWRSGVGAAAWWRQTRGLALIVLAVGLFTGLMQGWPHAAVVVLRVAALIGLAMAVTLTTPVPALIDACERALRPAERLGLLNAAQVALALALALRFIPEIWRNYQEIREAQAARGLGAHPLALLVPLVVRTLKRAEEVAQAIDARG